MEKERLYAIAIFALKPDPEHTVERKPNGGIFTRFTARQDEPEIHYDTTFTGEAGIERAVSEEVARDAALRQAKSLYPESDGWTLHNAHVVEIDLIVILEAAASIEANMLATDSEEREM